MEHGRPSKYKEEFDTQVEKLCKLGAKDTELADFFNVTEKTLNNWKIDHPSFFQSLKRGKDIYDNELIETALKNRALGYTHKETKVHFDKDGVPHEHEVDKHYPPDTTALIYWTKNRQPARWRDKQEMDIETIDRTGARTFGENPSDT